MANMFKLSDEIKTARVQSKYIDSLCKDMEGQATEAVSKKEWYERWCFQVAVTDSCCSS